MRKGIYFSLFIFVCVLAPFSYAAEPAMSGSGFQNDLLGNFEYVQNHILSLAEAVPADKYDWRPAEGVRSVGEVYAHIAQGNFGIPKMVGIQTSVTAPENLKEMKEKADIVNALKSSIENVRQAIKNTSPSDLDRKTKLFGMDMTVRGALLLLVGHLHEHLGQSIAYARSVGVVPPWTAAEQAAEKKNAQTQSY